MLKRPAAVALLVLVATGVGHTQQAAREQKPVKEHTFDLESSYIRMPLPPGDEKYGALDGYRMKEHVRAITAITRKHHEAGERYWGRLPGSKADVETEQYIAARFRDYGLAVEMQPVALTPQWRATDWSFTATGSGTTLTPTSIYPAEDTFNTPPAGVTLEIVWAGLGTELDFAGRDVKGKLVFMHSDPRPNAFQGTVRSNGGMQRAVQKGAAAVVVNVNIPGNITQTFASAPKVPDLLDRHPRRRRVEGADDEGAGDREPQDAVGGAIGDEGQQRLGHAARRDQRGSDHRRSPRQPVRRRL